MTFHLFGNILTSYGMAANNRGENEGNITTLQKIQWKNDIHTTVSAEAIRWALRYYWQTVEDNYEVNRYWHEQKNNHVWRDENFNGDRFIDDDVLGYMKAEAAKTEGEAESTQKSSPAKGTRTRAKGTTTAKRGVLEVTRAVSTLPYTGDITFNAKSGVKSSTSLYGTEVHATRYQYGFALTPHLLKDRARIMPVLDGLIALGQVGGNQARFLYDFAPNSIILRWTHDFAPRILYCFEETFQGNLSGDEDPVISVPQLIRLLKNEDIDPQELWVAGEIADTPDGEMLQAQGVNVLGGIKKLVAQLKQRIDLDLKLSQEQ